jgi:hypothetical protein
MLREFGRSALTLDSLFPPHPLFSRRFLEAMGGLLSQSPFDPVQPALDLPLRTVVNDAEEIVSELEAGGEVETSTLHAIVAEWTGLMYRLDFNYPAFIDVLLRRGNKAADAKASQSKADEERALLIAGVLGGAMGVALWSTLDFSDQALKADAQRDWKLFTLERMDFDERGFPQLRVTAADEKGVSFGCPHCKLRLKCPLVKAGEEGRCRCGGPAFRIPVPSAGRILRAAQNEALAATGRGICTGCGTIFARTPTLIHPFAIAGFCSRSCFERCGRDYYVADGFLFLPPNFEARCRCGSVLHFKLEESGRVIACADCFVSVVLPKEGDVARLARKSCPTCRKEMPYLGKECKACVQSRPR